MLLERGLPPVLYEGLFLALASQLVAQRWQSPTERGEFLPSLSVMSLPEASRPQQRASLLWDNVFHHNDFFLL